MAKNPDLNLSRRERQIMQVLYRMGKASVADIAAELPDPPSATAIRTMLRILEEKGQVRRRRDEKSHIYLPAVSKKKAGRAALSNVLATFFDGSLGDAVTTHLADPSTSVDREELNRLRRLVEQAKKESK